MKISSSPTSPKKYLLISILAVRKAAYTLFTSIISPSESYPLTWPSSNNFLTSENLATTVLSAVPAVSADSRVVSIIYAKKAAVVSNSIFALLAREATLVIAVEISSTLDAVFAASSEYTSSTRYAFASVSSMLKPRSALVIRSVASAASRPAIRAIFKVSTESAFTSLVFKPC